LPIALDATYSIGNTLSGVGVYSNAILSGLAQLHSEQNFHWWYRPHRFFRSFRLDVPANCSRRMLLEPCLTPRRACIFHGLNQRVPEQRLRRSVTTFHDLFVMTSEYSTPEFRKRFTRLSRQAAERSDLIIAVSQFTADQVQSLLGVERARIRVVHHGVQQPVVAPGHREKIILHVGAIQRRKNIGRLVSAFEQLDGDWRLVLAGSSGYGAQEIIDQIATSPARSRIELKGFVTESQLSELYATASIFAFPSFDEGFGMPVLEAMASGIPVVCSNRSALPEVAGDAAVAVDAERTDEMVQALKRLTSDVNLRNSLIGKGKERAAMFTWESAVQKTWEVYQELL
jgi:glycosyltransferase involved in cell wall biosynthesis